MFNRTISVGNLTRDIELKYLPNGGAVATTGLGMNRKFKKQDGSAGEEVCFVDITFFGRTAEIANQYLKRGSKVLVEGRLKLDQWTDQTGGKRSKHSIVVESLQMIDSKNNNSGGGEYSNPVTRNEGHTTSVNGKDIPVTYEHEIPNIDINDDEIPF